MITIADILQQGRDTWANVHDAPFPDHPTEEDVRLLWEFTYSTWTADPEQTEHITFTALEDEFNDWLVHLF